MNKLQVMPGNVVNANRLSIDTNGNHNKLMEPFWKFGKMFLKIWAKPELEHYASLTFNNAIFS